MRKKIFYWMSVTRGYSLCFPLLHICKLKCLVLRLGILRFLAMPLFNKEEGAVFSFIGHVGLNVLRAASIRLLHCRLLWACEYEFIFVCTYKPCHLHNLKTWSSLLHNLKALRMGVKFWRLAADLSALSCALKLGGGALMNVQWKQLVSKGTQLGRYNV